MQSPTNKQSTATSDERAQAILILIGEQIHSREPLTRATPIDALDIDSLDLVEIAQTINDDFGIRLDAQSLHEAVNLGDILDAISTVGANQ